jgi:DNA modification methylase
MITVVTDVVRENNQTYRLSWSEQCKDGSKMGVGCPEYLLLFRKLPSDNSKAYADLPVSKSKEVYTRGRWQIDARGKWNSSGDRFMSSEEIAVADLKHISRKFKAWMDKTVYNYEVHASLANELDKLGKLPSTFEALQVPARDQERVWSDISRMRVLNSEQKRKKLQNHVCPLQFDIVDRVITRYSNPGEVVFDPFGGIMTVPYRAIKLGRVGYGCELNPSYWADGTEYLKAADAGAEVPTLSMFEEGIFDGLDVDSEGDAGD